MEQSITFAGGRAKWVYQNGDGNVVLYHDGVPVWSTNTILEKLPPPPLPPPPPSQNITFADGQAKFVFQNGDGNVVLYHNGVPVWSTHTILEKLPLPPSSPNTLQVLSVKPGSRFFHHPDGAVVDYREATAMGIYRLWLDGDFAKVDALLAYFRSRKVNAIRPLFNLGGPYWEEMGRSNSHVDQGDHFWDQLVPFVNHASSYGIYTRLCLFGGVEQFVGHELDWVNRPDVVSDNPDAIAKMHAYVEQFVGTTRDLPSVLYEVANEPAQIGFGDDSAVVMALGERVKDLAPDRLMNFGAATDEDSLYYAQGPADFLDEHLRRVESWDYQASVKRLIEHPAVDQHTMPFVSGEWMNLGNIVRPGHADADGTPSTATAFATAAMLRVKRCIPTFHAECLLAASVPDAETDRALVAWSKALDLIPVEFPGTGCNGHWSCSPFSDDIFPPTEEATNDWDGPIRIYGLSGPEGYLGLSIREPVGYDLVGENGRVIETLHLEQWGDWQCRIVKA